MLLYFPFLVSIHLFLLSNLKSSQKNNLSFVPLSRLYWNRLFSHQIPWQASCHKTYWLISLAASLKFKAQSVLGRQREGSVYILHWLCSRNFNNLHEFWRSFSHNHSLSTELLLNSGGSHLERAAGSQSFQGYLVDRGKEDMAVCSPQAYLLECPKHIFWDVCFNILFVSIYKLLLPFPYEPSFRAFYNSKSNNKVWTTWLGTINLLLQSQSTSTIITTIHNSIWSGLQ